MPIFISYSSQDRTSLDALTTALKRAKQKVWFDQELGGGDAWWNAILEQIRSSDVFIVALSNNWLQSKPSQAELRYAQALNRPILPVQVGPVDSVRVNPVSDLQIIDYQNPTVDAGIQLVTAIHALQEKAPPLPSPLPDEPPLPFGYIMRLGNTLSEKELTPQQQLQLLVELRSGLDEDGTDPSARSDIAQLLRMLRMRHDVTYRTRTEIDNVLAEIEAKDGKSKPAAAPAGTASADSSAPTSAAPTVAAPAASPPPAPSRASTPQAATAPADSGGGNKKLLIIGGVALAAVIAIVLIVVFAGGGDTRKKAGSASSGTSAPAGPGTGGGTGAPAVTEVLLGVPEIREIMGDPAMVASGHADALRPPQGELSDAECLAAFEPFQESVYRPHSPTAPRNEVVHSPADAHRVVEATAKFPSAEKARAFVEESAAKWGTCAGKTVKYTGGGKSTEWTFAEVTGAAPKITQTRNDPAAGRTCQHALHAEGDLVIEVQACGAEVNDGAAKIAEQIGVKAVK